MELRQVRYFLAIAEEGNFGRAAVRLGIQQPPLSQQIQKLEAELGFALFVRGPRGASLTEAGTAFLPRARQALAALADGVQQGRLAAEGYDGTLTVAIAASLLSTGLPKRIRAFREAYPGVQLRLREMTTDLQLAAIERGEVDLGFARETAGTPSVASTVLYTEPLFAILPAGHRPKRLQNEPFVLFPRAAGAAFYDHIVAACRFTPRVVQEATEWFTIVRLVGAGIGVTVAPASVLPLCDDAVTSRKLRPVSHTAVVLLKSRGRSISPAAARFLEMATPDAATR